MVKTQYGELINLKLNVQDLEKLNQQRGFVRLTVAPRKEKWKYGETHTIYENEYKAESTATTEKKKK